MCIYLLVTRKRPTSGKFPLVSEVLDQNFKSTHLYNFWNHFHWNSRVQMSVLGNWTMPIHLKKTHSRKKINFGEHLETIPTSGKIPLVSEVLDQNFKSIHLYNFWNHCHWNSRVQMSVLGNWTMPIHLKKTHSRKKMNFAEHYWTIPTSGKFPLVSEVQRVQTCV